MNDFVDSCSSRPVSGFRFLDPFVARTHTHVHIFLRCLISYLLDLGEFFAELAHNPGVVGHSSNANDAVWLLSDGR